MPSLANVAYALAWFSGLTSAVPSGMPGVVVPAGALGRAGGLGHLHDLAAARLSIWVVRSTNAVLIESVVALSRVTGRRTGRRTRCGPGCCRPAG